MTASLTPSAFGQTVASSGSSTSAYGYGATSGYRNDGDAGLTLVGCRYYDAQVGRFITRDTYLDQRPYAYCDGDPVNSVDPSGHNGKVGKGVVTFGNALIGDAPLFLHIGEGVVIVGIVVVAIGTRFPPLIPIGGEIAVIGLGIVAESGVEWLTGKGLVWVGNRTPF